MLLKSLLNVCLPAICNCILICVLEMGLKWSLACLSWVFKGPVRGLQRISYLDLCGLPLSASLFQPRRQLSCETGRNFSKYPLKDSVSGLREPRRMLYVLGLLWQILFVFFARRGRFGRGSATQRKVAASAEWGGCSTLSPGTELHAWVHRLLGNGTGIF